MGAGWIARGADQPAPTGEGAVKDPWTPVGPDTASTPALTRPHQDPQAHPVDNTRSLFTRGKDLLFGHEPESPADADRQHVAGILPAVGAAVSGYTDDPLRGPDAATLAAAYPHLLGAQAEKIKAGYQETVGAQQVQNAERQVAGYNVLPQVAARMPGGDSGAKIDAMAKDPLVAKTARSLGISPQEFAGDWAQYSGLSPEQQADNAARARDALENGRANVTAGRGSRNQAWADERVWQPSDLKNGKLDPWSLKGVAFNAALAIPELAAVAGTTIGATAVGGPGAGMAAGGATAAALFAPAQREDAKNQIDDQVGKLLQKADDLDDAAPVGGKRGLNPVTEHLRQQAADLSASSDRIANTAGFLYAVGDAAGAVPVSSVLSRSPAGRAILDRIVGAAAGQTVGGRVGGAMVANGAGGMLQASLQKAVDAGIVHEDTSLKDALRDIAYTGVVSAVTAAPISIAHEAATAPGRARARRDLDSDELLARVKTASDAMGRPQTPAGETYPGYEWNAATSRYEPTAANPAGNATKPRISGTTEPPGETKGPSGATNGPSGETPTGGAAGARAAYQAKVQTLNDAAAAAEKRSDVTLEPEEEGWSVHVKGEPVARFDTVEAAREAIAGARKLVGTKPAQASTPVKTPETTGVEPPVVPKATQSQTRQPEDPLERTQPVQAERRVRGELRQRVADMSADQMKAALLTHELTGIPNRRAYEDAPKRAVQVSVDSDGLKAINDFGTHAAGDQALKAVASAMHAEDPQSVYHLSGDEFMAQADHEDGAHDLMARVNKRLADAVVEVTMPDGKVFHLKGLGVSYGVGKDSGEAEANLAASKTERQAQGLRAPRGELPAGATIRPRRQEGGPDHGGQVAGEPGRPKDLTGGGGAAAVLEHAVETPAVPTRAQADAGNYFKPAAAWHGIPIKVENVRGQYRRFIHAATGKPGRRQMRADYGYFPGTKGADADGVDVMMGPHADADKAYVIDQLDHTGKTFDEHKVQVGVRNEAEARAQYLSHYPKDWKGLGAVTELSADQLKHWLREGDLTKPINPESVPAAKVVRGVAPDARHDSVLQFLARHPRGLDREEAISQGIDPADMGSAAAHVGIKRAFRHGGLSFDHAAEALHEAGYPVADAEGHYSPNVLLDRVDDELRGTRHYSTRNESKAAEAEHARDWRQPLSDKELGALTLDETRARLDKLRAEQERLERELERAGLDEPAEHDTEAELDRIPFMRGKPPGVQQDLFGAVVNVKNEIKRVEAALDAKRNSGQESVETGRADDLFSQARQQVDVEDTVAARLAAVEKQLGIKTTGALEDAGEKIGGARKDKWAERGMRLADLSTMTEAEAATLVNKKAVWNPDWAQVIAAGMPTETAALAKVLFDQLAARPRFNTPDGRRQYVEVLGRVRDMLLAAKTDDQVANVENALATELGVPRGYSLASTPEQKLAREKFWSIQKGRRSTLRVAYSDQRKAKALIAAGWPAKKVKEDTGPVKPKSEEEGPPKRPHLEAINRVGPPVRTADVSSTDFIKAFGFRGLEFGNWAASDERQALLNHAYEGLHDLARVMKLPPQALSLNGTMGLALGARGGGRFAAHYEPGKLVINMTKINGAGALAHEWGHALDHYMGETGRADAYTTTARGATGWYTDRRSLGHLRPEMQAAWEGVMAAMYKRRIQAAEVIRNSDLSIERAQAQRREIEEAIKERPGDTNLPQRLEWIDRRLGSAQAERLRAVMHPDGEFGTEPTKYVREASGLGDYWRRPTEMFARAFEAFIEDKIAAEGNQSDYLVHGAQGRGYPGEDRPQVNAAIQHLVDTLQTRAEGGKEVLFRRGPGGVGHSLKPDAVRAVVDRILKTFGVKPDVTVVGTLHDLDDHPEVGHIVRDAGNADAVAFVHPRTQKIYIVADQVTSAEHAATVLAHEYVTHFGLRAAFGDRRNAQYQAILEGVAKAMPAALRERGEEEFPGTYNPLNRHHRNIAAEEVLAYYGQQYAADQSVPAKIKRWLDKLKAMVRDWIRQVLGLPQKFDELFVRRTLADLESYLRRGKGPRAGSESARARDEPESPAFAGHQDTFFSGLARAVDAAKREKGTGAEWEATLRNMAGVKSEELEWTGLKDWLDGRGRVTKAEVADYVAAHRVEVGEVEHGIPQQPPLTAEHLDYVNHWLDVHDFGLLDEDQRHWLTRGGQPTYDELRNLNERVGLPLDDLPKVATSEDIVDELSMLGYQVHEDDVTGQPYLMEKDATGTHIEVADGDAPAEVRELLDQLRAGPLAPVKYPQYVAPGGKDYREILLTMEPPRPEALEKRKAVFDRWKDRIEAENARILDYSLSQDERSSALKKMEEMRSERDAEADRVQPIPTPFLHSHWDEPNVLAHVRFDERTGPQGERVLHVAEVQSDWHQKGRKVGYNAPKRAPPSDLAVARFFGLTQAARGTPEMMESYRTEMMAHHDYVNNNGVPDAPFKTTWPELAMKRMLRYAAEHGFDALSWDTGETSAERYNLSNQIDSLRWLKKADGNIAVMADKDGRSVFDRSVAPEQLPDVIGKDMSDRIATDINAGVPGGKYSGLDLSVGGAGMKAFYDKILPAAVGKLVKKWGAAVEPGQVGTTNGLGPMIFYGPELSSKEVLRAIEVHEPPVQIREQLEQVADLLKSGRDLKEAMEQVGSPAAAKVVGGEMRQQPTAIDAHVVHITPAMRDSVMAGQPMFLKRRKGSTGTQPPAPKRGAYALARRAVAAIPNNEFALSLRRIADPAGVSPPARSTALVMREALGELAQASEEALRNLERYSKAFDLLAKDDRYAFIDAMEGGLAQKNRDLQPAADAIRTLLDDWRERIRGLGTGALDNFIENYFPHIWQHDSNAKKVFGQIFGRRPLKGPASFLKERTIPTTREGLDAGLEPISSNPLILAFAKLREMQRFYTGVKLMQRFKDEGLAKFLPSGKLRPDDWAEINDAVGRVRQWSEVEQGFVERGKYIMPADAARVINNHLSASALRNFLPAQVFRVMSNAVNALQLGFSAFHLGFTTLDAVISKNALAIERLAHGEPLRAAAALLEASTGIGGAITNVVRGRRLLKAYANTGAVNPALARIVEGLTAAGGRVKMDNYYQAAQGLSPFKGVGFATLASDVRAALTQPSGKVWAATKVLGGFPIEYATRLWRDLEEIWRVEPLKILPIMSAMEIAGRMTRASTSIIMEHIVPLQKLGVFSDLAADHLRRNPAEDPVAFAAAMQKIWNSVDNRLGEMVYDNVFWNRTFKEVNHMMVRAVGWNLGTIRELGGAPVDVVKLLDYIARGAPAETESPDLGKGAAARLAYEQQKSTLHRVADKVGHKIPYTLALIGSTMILGAALTYLFTGKGPEETKDYFFPWTGRRTKYGTKERISMPSYTKDLVEYGTQPVTTVINKANPIFGIMHAIYANEDFFGNAVRDPDASVWRQMWQGAQYAARETQPFSLQGTKQFVGGGDMDTRGKILSTMPYVGFGPAPARVTSPEQMDRYQLRETEKSYIRGLQRRLKAATQKGDKEEVDRIRAELRDSKLRERGTEHDIREDQVRAKEAADKISSLVVGRSRADAVAALHAAGLPAFAELWRALPDHPRPRVAQSLDGFA